MDNQHLGRNSSSWFPPSVSEGYKMGPCEQEGGSERRVCVRARTGRREAVLLAQDTQPRGNGSEGIIKSGKGLGAERRCLERRVYKTRVLLHRLRCQLPAATPSISQTGRAKYLEVTNPARLRPQRAAAALLPGGGCRSSAGSSQPPHPWGPLLPGVSRTAAQKGCTSTTHVAGLGLPLTSHPGGRCDAIEREALIGYRGLSQLAA